MVQCGGGESSWIRCLRGEARRGEARQGGEVVCVGGLRYGVDSLGVGEICVGVLGDGLCGGLVWRGCG